MESKSTSEAKQKLMGLVDYVEQLTLENSALKSIMMTATNPAGQLRIPNWEAELQDLMRLETLQKVVADSFALPRQGILAALDEHAAFEVLLRLSPSGKVN